MTDVPNPIEIARRAVQDEMTRGDFAQAERMLAEAQARHPKSVGLKVLMGQILAHAAPETGADHILAVMRDMPPGPPRHHAADQLAATITQYPLPLAAATSFALRLTAADLEQRELNPVVSALTDALPDADRLAFLQAVAPKSGLFRLEWKLAVAETEAGHPDAALTVLETARAAGRCNAQSTMLEADLLDTVERPDAAIALLDQAIATEPDRPDYWRRLISQLDRAVDIDRAVALISQALTRWPEDWMLVYRLNRIKAPQAALLAMQDLIRPAAESAAQDDRYRFQYALACLNVGDLSRARSLLADPFISAVSHMADAVRDALAVHDDNFWRQGNQSVADRTSDLMVAKVPCARATVIVTSGVFFGYMPMQMIDAFLAPLGVNRVYLRDFNKRAYCRGIQSLGPDEPTSLAALAALLDDLGPRRRITIGSSLGGYGALRIGARLGVEAAVSLSGPSDPRLSYADLRPSIWNTAWFAKLVLDRDPSLMTDLVPILSAPQSAATRILQYYPAGNASDCGQALRLDGLPRVSLRPLEGVGHHVVANRMMADGSLAALLDDLLA